MSVVLHPYSPGHRTVCKPTCLLPARMGAVVVCGTLKLAPAPVFLRVY